MEGEIDLNWQPVRGAASYAIVRSTTGNVANAGDWAAAGTSTKSKASVSGLTSGTRYWFRVAAVGSAGQGPWSDPATAIAS
jgi:chitodextrinase